MAGFFRFELLYIMVIMGGSMSFGLTMAYYSPAQQGICEDLGLSSTLGNVFNSLAAMLSIVTGAFNYLLINKIGRRKTLLLTAIIATMSWCCLPLASKNSWYVAFIFRSLLGLTVGAFSSVCPLYITELSPLELRGAYGNLHQFGVVIGAALAYGLGICCNWRLLSWLCAIPPGLCTCLTLLIPESPRHLATDTTSLISEGTVEKDSICQKKYVKSLLISLGLMFFQQFSGVNGFLSTLETMFKNCHSTIKPSVAAFLVGLSGMIATGVSAPLVHKIGQKLSWDISSSLCCLTLLLVAINAWEDWSSYIPVVCMFIDNLVFGLGLGPIPWVITPELFPDTVRPVATSLMTALNWTFATIVMFIWPEMQTYFGFAPSVLTFSIICALGFLFGLTLIPDTKGKEMGQIYENDLTNSQPLLQENSQ